jgi:OmpA-OmpF porin, OOP family
MSTAGPRRLCLAAALLAGALLLAACSSRGTRVVLLPEEGGAPSAVVVRAKGGEHTLDKPYQRATAIVGASGAPAVDQADPGKVRAENRALFELAPPKPQRFVVYFEVGGTVLTPASQQAMSEALVAAMARSGGELVVIGHTDTKGSLEQNDELSRRRAQQVRQMFVERQFPPERIEAVGRGERELAVPTADEVDEPRNRRVTIEVR